MHPFNAELNPICHLLALLGGATIVVVSRLRVKMGLREVGGGRGDWVDLAQDRDGWRALVNAVMNLRAP